jgi:hypothetical protein
MPQFRLLPVLAAILIASVAIVPVIAYSTPDSITAAGKVYVSNVTYDPAVFFDGDTGTASYTVTNGATDLGVVVNHATLHETAGKIRLVSDPFQNSAQIGPGKSHTFTFTILAEGAEGFYYPTFSLSFRDADNLFHRQMVQVDNTPLILTVVDKPDAFTAGKKKTVSLQVANPRRNAVENVVLSLSGDGLEFSPSQVYVGSIGPGAKGAVNFSVTPARETTAHMTLDYDNGNNPHSRTLDLPVTFGADKKSADPVMSNVQVTGSGGSWTVTGDVNNAGLETANTVMVTALPPAVPEDPYKVYVVGALKPDDFGSFEITFAAEDAETVPLRLSYKDADGNVYDKVQDVKIQSSPSIRVVANSPAQGPVSLPVMAGIALVLLFVGGWAYYLRRNRK